MMNSHPEQKGSPQKQIEDLQMKQEQDQINLPPQGIENPQERKNESIQIVKEDQESKDDLQIELDKFLLLDLQQLKQILDYNTNIQIQKEYNQKLLEYNYVQKKIEQVQYEMTETQKEILITQGFIHNNLIRDNDRIQLMEDILSQLNQIKGQSNTELNYSLSTSDIQQMKSFKNPPLQVEKVAEIIVLFLNHSASNSIWVRFKQLMTNPNEFTQRLIQFKIEEVPQTPLTQARNAFERLNSDQLQRSNQVAYILHRWIQYQFRIMDIINIHKDGINEITKHKKALKFQQFLEELKLKLKNFEQIVQEYNIYKKPLKQEQEEKAEKILQTVKLFKSVQTDLKLFQYGNKLNYEKMYKTIHSLPCYYPIIINDFFNQDTNSDTVVVKILELIKSPTQLHNNLKQLNFLIGKDTSIYLEEIYSLLYQMYLNNKRYPRLLLLEILQLIHQFIQLFPNQIEFDLHQILEILYDYKLFEESDPNSYIRSLLGIIKYIESKAQINVLQAQLWFEGIPVIDNLINLYLYDSQNKTKLQFNEQQWKDLKAIILKLNLNIKETVENILENYQIIQKSQEHYDEVNKTIEKIKLQIEDNNQQIEIQKNQILEYNELLNKWRVIQRNLFFEKKGLEDQLDVLKDKDSIIKEQIDKLKKLLDKPIHYGIKIQDLGIFKWLSKFNSISYFAAKITLIQLGIYQYTPDMIKKHLGSQISLKKLKNLTINHLNENQFDYLEQLLIDFNQKARLSQFQTNIIQNLINIPYRIFRLKRLKVNNDQLINLRSDLLEKQRIFRNKINTINQIRQDIEKQLITNFEERINQAKQNIKQLEVAEKKIQQSFDQFEQIQQLQEFMDKLKNFDTIDLCISLIRQNSTIKQEVQTKKQYKNHLFCLTYLYYESIPKGLLKEYSRFNLLLMYLKDQYQNNKVEFQSEKKGLLNQFEMPIVVDALSYWIYLSTIAKTNMNVLIGIFSYQLFYNEFGHQVQAICIQPDNNLIDNQLNTNYQIRVLYEILQIKYGNFTLSVILQFFQQAINIQSKISSIYEILKYQIIIDAQNEMEFKEFQQQLQEIFNFYIKKIVI